MRLAKYIVIDIHAFEEGELVLNAILIMFGTNTSKSEKNQNNGTRPSEYATIHQQFFALINAKSNI